MARDSFDAALATLSVAVASSSPCAVFGFLPPAPHKPVAYLYWTGSEFIINTFGAVRDELPMRRYRDVSRALAHLAPLGPHFLHWKVVAPTMHGTKRQTA